MQGKDPGNTDGSEGIEGESDHNQSWDFPSSWDSDYTHSYYTDIKNHADIQIEMSALKKRNFESTEAMDLN